MTDNSQIISYSNCQLQHHLRYDVGLEKIQENEVEHDRNMGKAIHVAVAMFHLGKNSDDCFTAFKEAYPEQLDIEDKAKTQENGLILLERYFTRYSDDFDKYEILGVEERIEFDLGGHPYAVKCDTVVRNKKYDDIYGLEKKTTGKTLSYDYWSRYDPNSQICSQTAGIKHKYGSCAGIIIDAMAFGFRKNKYKEFPAGFHCSFERMEFQRNQSQLDLWERSTIKVMEDIRNSREMSRWSMNTDACRYCSFKSICSSGWSWEEDSELILLNFKQKENPLDYLMAEESA